MQQQQMQQRSLLASNSQASTPFTPTSQPSLDDLRITVNNAPQPSAAVAAAAAAVPSPRKTRTWGAWTLMVLQRIWTVTKYLYSVALLGITLGICFWGIGIGASNFFPVPVWLQFILFFVFILYLGILEGTMISLSQLRRASPSTYAQTHKATLRNANLAFRPDYLEKFLMGRQANVIVLVFMLSRLLTDTSALPVAPWLLNGFIQTGLFGSFIVLIIGNLVPQVTAAKFPVQFLNFSFIYVVIRWCLFIRWIGLPHACWLCAKSIAFVLRLKWDSPSAADNAAPASTDANAAAAANDSAPTADQRPVYGDRYEDFFKTHSIATSLPIIEGSVPPAIRMAIAAPQHPQTVAAHDDIRWTAPDRIAELFREAHAPVPTYLAPATAADYVPAHIAATQLLVEHERLLHQLQAAGIDVTQMPAMPSTLVSKFAPVVQAACLDRLKMVQ